MAESTEHQHMSKLAARELIEALLKNANDFLVGIIDESHLLEVIIVCAECRQLVNSILMRQIKEDDKEQVGTLCAELDGINEDADLYSAGKRKILAEGLDLHSLKAIKERLFKMSLLIEKPREEKRIRFQAYHYTKKGERFKQFLESEASSKESSILRQEEGVFTFLSAMLDSKRIRVIGDEAFLAQYAHLAEALTEDK